MWQTLHDDYLDQDFVVIAVAMDNDIEAARPWIEAARPAYPVLIDRDHRLAELYDMVNVPQAVWIDERGRIVRPAENAGAYEGFRAMDPATRTVPDAIAAKVAETKSTYVAAIRDWIESGPASVHAFSPDQARAHLRASGAGAARAHVLFRLGLHLRQTGKRDEADAALAEASRLHPDSWNIWRQAAQPLDNGLAAGPDFWARVQALGEKHYYEPVDMEGMPTDGPPGA